MPQTFFLHLMGFLFAVSTPVFIGKEFYFIALMCTLACIMCLTRKPVTAKAIHND